MSKVHSFKTTLKQKIKSKKKILKVLAFFCCLLFIISIIFYINFPLKLNNIPNSKILYDQNWIEIWEIPFEKKVRHREVEFDEIPDFYKKVLIFWEDRDFYNNISWIDFSWIARSFVNNIKSWKIVEWGSTISTQFIRNNLWLNEKRTFTKKILEFYRTIILNFQYSKDQILTKYCNQIFFGNMNYWIKSASYYFFGKSLNNLTKAEMIAIFTIQKNSTKYNPYFQNDNFKKRFSLIANYLKENKIITEYEFNEIINENLNFKKNEKNLINDEKNNNLPYIIDFYSNLKNYNFINQEQIIDSKINTTINYNLTKKIEEIWLSKLYELSWKNVKDYWVIILDRKTNELKVMIGWKTYYSTDWQVNSTLSPRQPGSTIKPFTYLLATKNFGIKPNDTILDLPVLYKTKDNYSYEPQNYSTKFEWEVSIGEALAQSINVPAIKLLEKIWVNNLLKFLQNIWIKSLNQDGDYYWLALTLGDWEVTLFELVRAYWIFVNDGKYCDIILYKWKKSDCKNIIDKKHTDEINYILTNRYLKIWGYPINSALDFENINVFFKTGTSRNFRDNWTVGYTDNYVIWVWAWNKDGSNMKWVSWATWAGEIFGSIVRYLEKTTENNQKINISKNKKDYLEITFPLEWQVFKIDNTKSLEIQKIKPEFRSNLEYDSFKWRITNSKNEEIKVKNSLFGLKVWKYSIKISLEKNNWEIKESSSNFEVRE